MKIIDRLRMMKEIERRNQERIEVFNSARKPDSQPRKKKTKRNRGKRTKRTE